MRLEGGPQSMRLWPSFETRAPKRALLRMRLREARAKARAPQDEASRRARQSARLLRDEGRRSIRSLSGNEERNDSHALAFILPPTQMVTSTPPVSGAGALCC